jgi:hypothetical protein
MYLEGAWLPAPEPNNEVLFSFDGTNRLTLRRRDKGEEAGDFGPLLSDPKASVHG